MRQYEITLIGYADGGHPKPYARLIVNAANREGAEILAGTLADGRSYKVKACRGAVATDGKRAR